MGPACNVCGPTHHQDDLESTEMAEGKSGQRRQGGVERLSPDDLWQLPERKATPSNLMLGIRAVTDTRR